MKERRVRANRPTVSIDTGTQVVDQFDTESFDAINLKTLKALFGTAYADHVKFIMELVTSRIALDTAMVNVDGAIKEHLNGALSIHEASTVKAIDTAYEIAIKLYAYEKAFGFLDVDTRKEVLINVLSNSRNSGVGAGPKVGAALGRATGGSGDDLNKIVKGLEDRLKHAIGGQPTNPYGEDEARPKKKGVGVSKRRSK